MYNSCLSVFYPVVGNVRINKLVCFLFLSRVHRVYIVHLNDFWHSWIWYFICFVWGEREYTIPWIKRRFFLICLFLAIKSILPWHKHLKWKRMRYVKLKWQYTHKRTYKKEQIKQQIYISNKRNEYDKVARATV